MALVGGDLPAETDQRGHGLRGPIGQLGGVRGVQARDDEDVERRLGVEVAERDGVVGLRDDLGRDLPRHDATEQAVIPHGGHGVTKCGRPRT